MFKDRKSINKPVTDVTTENQPDVVTALDVPRIPPVCKPCEQQVDNGWKHVGDAAERIMARLSRNRDGVRRDDAEAGDKPTSRQ